ncbi:flavin reductase family protein [Streptomyces sp. NPDC055078]
MAKRSATEMAAESADSDREFRDSFFRSTGSAATGVTVVTTDGAAGRGGQTVSAMAAVSNDPPMVLIALHGRSPVREQLTVNGVFTVNVLGVQHDHVADTFAGRPWPGKEKWDFTCGTWVAESGRPPYLHDAIAVFECAVAETLRTGTHTVFVGRVSGITRNTGTPLVYAAHAYHGLTAIDPSTFDGLPEAQPQPRVRKQP